jgi:hypothetical protein
MKTAHIFPTKLFILAATTALLSACGTTTGELRNGGGLSYSTVVHGQPETLYRQAVVSTRDCMAKRAFKVESEFYPDTQESAITIVPVGAQTDTALAVINMKSNKDGSSRFTANYIKSPFGDGEMFRPLMERVALWAEGKPASCEFK